MTALLQNVFDEQIYKQNIGLINHHIKQNEKAGTEYRRTCRSRDLADDFIYKNYCSGYLSH